MKRERELRSWQAPVGRWNAADGRAMKQALSASGLSQRVFAAQHGIAAHRVSYWVGKQRASSSAFAEAQVVSGRESGEGAAQVELELGNGRRLALRGTWDEAGIQRWVRALEGL